MQFSSDTTKTPFNELGPFLNKTSYRKFMICQFGKEKGAGAEMCPGIVSGIVTGKARAGQLK